MIAHLAFLQNDKTTIFVGNVINRANFTINEKSNAIISFKQLKSIINFRDFFYLYKYFLLDFFFKNTSCG